MVGTSSQSVPEMAIELSLQDVLEYPDATTDILIASVRAPLVSRMGPVFLGFFQP